MQTLFTLLSLASSAFKDDVILAGRVVRSHLTGEFIQEHSHVPFELRRAAAQTPEGADSKVNQTIVWELELSIAAGPQRCTARYVVSPCTSSHQLRHLIDSQTKCLKES